MPHITHSQRQATCQTKIRCAQFLQRCNVAIADADNLFLSHRDPLPPCTARGARLLQRREVVVADADHLHLKVAKRVAPRLAQVHVRDVDHLELGDALGHFVHLVRDLLGGGLARLVVELDAPVAVFACSREQIVLDAGVATYKDGYYALSTVLACKHARIVSGCVWAYMHTRQTPSKSGTLHIDAMLSSFTTNSFVLHVMSVGRACTLYKGLAA